jgi:hypothetical protein
MWTGLEALLNGVAQKQISGTAGNRTSLLHRVLNEQPVCHRREREREKKFIPASCFAFEIGNQFLQNIIVIHTICRGDFRTFLFK